MGDVFEIAYCPFCGEKLVDIEETGLADYGQFVHFDYSEWGSKRQ